MVGDAATFRSDINNAYCGDSRRSGKHYAPYTGLARSLKHLECTVHVDAIGFGWTEWGTDTCAAKCRTKSAPRQGHEVVIPVPTGIPC
jgi:hypothetical protein